MRLAAWAAVVITMASACASAPRGPAGPSPLTSVDTAYYEVPGNTRSEWAVYLPRASRAAGIEHGGAMYTLAHLLVIPGYTRTTPTGCQFDRSLLQLRVGHVMPRLSASASPGAADRAAWEAFVAALWVRAHLREEAGQRIADSVRAELRHERAQECAPLIVQARRKVDEFGARYLAAVQAAEASLGDGSGPALP